MPSDIVSKCSKAIASKGWNIAFVESATAGRMCSEFSLTEHSGKILRGGISCYEVFIKEKILKVPHELITRFTAESAEVTRSLAENAAPFFQSDITVAITGLASPGGSETPEKPVGTMFFHIIMPGKNVAHREIFSGDPASLLLKAIDKAALLILREIS